MAKSYVLLDEVKASITEKPIEDCGVALAHAQSISVSHLLACDDMLVSTLVHRLHECTNRSEIWDVVAADLNGLIDVIPVSQEAIAASLRKPRPGEYPANITRAARPIWDALVVDECFKKAIVGRTLVAAFAVAVKWLEEACRRRNVHAFTEGDAGGKHDATTHEKMMRELRLCKSYVEQVFRNLKDARCVVRQTNWTTIKVSLRGNMFSVQTSKRLSLVRGAASEAVRVFKRYEGYQNKDLKAKPTANSSVVFDLRESSNDIMVVLSFDLTKAQLAALVEVPATTSGEKLASQAQIWLQRELQSALREVVAGEPDFNEATASGETDAKQREKATRVAKKIVKALSTGKGKILDDGSLQVVVTDSVLLGAKPLVVRFNDDRLGANTGGEFERASKFASLRIRIDCDFRHYGLPIGLRNDVEDTDLFTTLEHELLHLANSKRTFGRDLPSYEMSVFPEGRNGPIDEHAYFNNADEKNAFLQSMISEWARRGDHNDLDKTFPEFLKRFKAFWSHDRREHDFLEMLDAAGERRMANRLYNYWKLNQPSVTASSNELRVLEEFEFEPLNGGEKKKLPVGTVLRLVKSPDDEPTYQIAHPPEVLGLKLKLNREQHEHCAHVDNDVETFDGSIDAAFELLTEEFRSLPTFKTTNLKVGKLLGTIETWPFAENRAWMHHLNLKVKHPGLTFEVITHGGQKHLAAIYHGEW